MITGISGFGFFGFKSGRFVTHNCFSKMCSLKRLFFIVFWGVRAFWARLSQKKRNFGHPPKRKNRLITEKFFGISTCSFLFFPFFFFFLCFFLFCFCLVICFGPPHLALNPPYFCLFVLFVLFF